MVYIHVRYVLTCLSSHHHCSTRCFRLTIVKQMRCIYIHISAHMRRIWYLYISAMIYTSQILRLTLGWVEALCCAMMYKPMRYVYVWDKYTHASRIISNICTYAVSAKLRWRSMATCWCACSRGCRRTLRRWATYDMFAHMIYLHIGGRFENYLHIQ